ncbi:MAG: F0F1 ATP synthase subunit B [Elusimicrobia bacterium]|nr:F0F1 ATP synthase subunit B [Elusimicrobiota bacterium]
MEKLTVLGLDTNLFIAQVVNFTLLFFALKYLLFRPLQGVMQRRRDKIAQGLKDADDAARTLIEADSRRLEIITAARASAETIMSDTKVAAHELKKQLFDTAVKNSEGLVEQARHKAAEEFEEARKNLSKMALDLSQTVVGKVLNEVFTPEQKEEILNKAIEKIKTSKTSGA